MIRFIKKTFLLSLGLIILYAFIYFGFNSVLNSNFGHSNAVFIWGDSQAYYGLDLEELSNTLEKNVYTSANPGAGVYDFLVFTDQVSENSEVIISISKLGQIRRKDNDFNRSGLSLWAVKEMISNDYSLNEIMSIIKLNLKPKRNITQSTALFEFSDTMEIGLPLAHFENYYKEVPPFLIQKQNLYLVGIENLISKDCKISFLDFPYHHILDSIESQSKIKEKTNDFNLQIGKLFNEFSLDTIQLNKSQNIFKDLSHLNSVGAKDLSKKLAKNILEDKRTTMYVAE